MQVSAAGGRGGGTSTFLEKPGPGRLSLGALGRTRELWELRAGVPSSGALLVYITPLCAQQL